MKAINSDNPGQESRFSRGVVGEDVSVTKRRRRRVKGRNITEVETKHKLKIDYNNSLI